MYGAQSYRIKPAQTQTEVEADSMLLEELAKSEPKPERPQNCGSETMRTRRARVWEREGWGPNLSARGDIARTSTLCPTYGTAATPARAAPPAEHRRLIRTTTLATQIH